MLFEKGTKSLFRCGVQNLYRHQVWLQAFTFTAGDDVVSADTPAELLSST